MPDDQSRDGGREGPQPETPAAEAQVTRRQFLRRAGVVGAATVLVPNLLQHGDAAALPSADEAPTDQALEETVDDTTARVHAGKVRITLNVNGEDRAATIEPRTTLLNALRNHLDPAVTGPKLVCDRGACGACTVEIDGKTALACMLLAADMAGKKIGTVEGLSEGDTLNPVQAAFVTHDALMCGFCTPGFVMSVQNYLKKNPHPTLDQIRAACAGNTCRCGAYPRVFEAALAAAASAKES